MTKKRAEVRGLSNGRPRQAIFTGEYVAGGNRITVNLDGGGTKTELYNSPSPEATAYSILWDLIRARLSTRE